MSESNAPGRQVGGLNPQALQLEDLARILSACGLRQVTVEMLQADLDDGAPRNADGSVNLVHYVAWVVRELLRGD